VGAAAARIGFPGGEVKPVFGVAGHRAVRHQEQQGARQRYGRNSLGAARTANAPIVYQPQGDERDTQWGEWPGAARIAKAPVVGQNSIETRLTHNEGMAPEPPGSPMRLPRCLTGGVSAVRASRLGTG
jgi:hypothetical protein